MRQINVCGFRVHSIRVLPQFGDTVAVFRNASKGLPDLFVGASNHNMPDALVAVLALRQQNLLFHDRRRKKNACGKQKQNRKHEKLFHNSLLFWVTVPILINFRLVEVGQSWLPLIKRK